MLDYSTKQSLIVSSVVGENDGTATDESAFFEIPLDDDMKEIEVSVLKWTTPPESPQISAMNDGDRVNPDSNSYSDDDHVYDDTVNLIQTSDTLRSLAENRRGSNGFGSISGRSSPGVHMSGTPPHLPDKPKWLTQHTQHIMQSDTNAIAHSTGGRETAVTGSIKYDNIPPTLPVARSTERIVPIPQASVEEDPG